MTEDEMKKRARERIIETHTAADKDSISISLCDDFFSGVVAIVDYTETAQKKRDFVYFKPGGKISHTQNVEAFIRSFAGRQTDKFKMILYGFGGLLALMITATVCVIAATSPPVPEVLSGALTLILGFYFGTFAAQERND